jgi:hypothetical protein
MINWISIVLPRKERIQVFRKIKYLTMLKVTKMEWKMTKLIEMKKIQKTKKKTKCLTSNKKTRESKTSSR